MDVDCFYWLELLSYQPVTVGAFIEPRGLFCCLVVRGCVVVSGLLSGKSN